ncbi:MAG: NUDIX domain-containing protein [Candidatus Kerfeldbacteria bacterium]|nr:NUDIX domain-containing protein [Candidatus Kerfeldbacteria bacterium]
MLVQESKYFVRGQYNFPAGNMELGETIVECATREAFEETGFRVKPTKLIGIYQVRLTQRGNTLIAPVVVSKIIGGRLRITSEHPAIQWFSYDEIKALAKQGKIRSNNVLAAIERYRRKQVIPLSVFIELPSKLRK